MMETRRQLVHFSGLLFVLLAQVVGGVSAGIYFFLIAATFLAYSEYVVRETKRTMGMLESLEKRMRDFVIRFERKDVKRPFSGAIWFYAGCGFTFLLFSLPEASAACAMLAVGDSVSTLVGKR
ncbi:MAG: hypothetical protein DRO99_05060, partial [Candidatus Aenigmatarchaeota archaeon]